MVYFSDVNAVRGQHILQIKYSPYYHWRNFGNNIGAGGGGGAKSTMNVWNITK